MEAKIFVVEIPSLGDVFEKLASALFDDFDAPKCENKQEHCCERKRHDECCSDSFDLQKKIMNASKMEEIKPEWEVKGTPADENLRFGYGLEVDEPRYQQFDNDEDFLEARQAFDDFVDAGEHCRELGLEKTNANPITKCNAVRKPIGCPPPMDRELLGESQFPWWEIVDWNH